MDEQLYKLRLECHQAVSEYHRAVEHWSTVLRAQEPSAAGSATLQRYRDIATKYNHTLEALIAYLKSLEPTKLVTEELSRTLKLQDLLRREREQTF